MPTGEQVIIKTNDVRVRIIALGPYEEGEWHYHTDVVDNFFCLTGAILVCMKDKDKEISLSPGERYAVNKGRIHRIANMGTNGAEYLLVQGVGIYDFNIVGQ